MDQTQLQQQLEADAKAVMAKVLELFKRDNVGHEVAINALGNLAFTVAKHNKCCTFQAGMLLTHLGAALMAEAAKQAQQPIAAPVSQHLH